MKFTCKPLPCAARKGVSAAALLSLLPTAWCQTTGTSTDSSAERVEITARKRAEPLQEVPVAARTYSGSLLSDEGVVDLRGIAGRSASTSTVDLGASFSSEVVLRGAGTGRANNAETATGLYRNGAYASGGNIGGRSFNKMDFFDVQRVEVMRGPQGALYGRGAVGGAINIINNKPKSTPSASIMAMVGSDDMVGVEAIINQPLSDTTLVRAGFKSSRTKGGTFTATAGGTPIDSDHFDGARVSLSIAPTERFSYNLQVDGFSEAGPSFATSQWIFANPDRYTRAFDTPSRFKRQEWTVIGEGTYEFEAMTLTALTQFKGRSADTRDNNAYLSNVFGNTNLTLWERLSGDDMQRFSQEVRVQNRDAGPWQWLLGAEMLTLKDTYFVDLNGAIKRARTNNSVNRTVSDDTSYGLFGLLGYDVTKELNVTGELRQQRDQKKFQLQSTTYTFPTGTSATAQDSGPVTQSLLVQDYDRSFDATSAVAALSYKFTPTFNTYLRYAQAARPGGFNNDPDRNTATSSPAGPRISIPYEQEKAKTSEIGIKTEWFNRALRFNLAAYRSEIDNVLINGTVATTPPGSSTSRNIVYIENGGTARMDGVEIDTGAALPLGPGRLLVDASANITNTTILDGRLAGKDVPQTRPKQGSLSVTYEAAVFGLQRAYLNVNTQVLRGGFQDGNNAIAMDKVNIVNLGFGVRAAKWYASANVFNVNNDTFITNYGSAARLYGYVNRPRSWQVQGGINF